MRRINVILLLLAVFILFNSCAKQAESNIITVSIYPFYMIADGLAGDFAEIRLMIPQGSSPHTWSPRPSDISGLEKSSLIIANGFGLEGSLLRKMREYKNAVILEDSIHPAECATHEGTVNPHIWLDAAMLDSIIRIIGNGLKEKFPANADIIDARMEDMRYSVHSADSIIMEEANAYADKRIITFHEAFHYFAERYNIEIAAAVEPVPGKDPTLKDLADIGNLIKKYNLKAVFTEPQLNPKGADILAEEYGLQVIVLDPLGSSADIYDISALLEYNWQQIKRGLD